MVVMNLFAGREQRCRRREWTGKAEGEKNPDSSIDRHTLPCVKQLLVGRCCVIQGVQLGTL